MSRMSRAAYADMFGPTTGDKVRLATRRGSLELRAWIDGRGKCPKGHVFVPFFDETKLINRLTLDAHCPFSKEPDYKKCAATVGKVSQANAVPKPALTL